MGGRVGFHVSIAGGISNSVSNAKKLGCTAFQIFTRNPRGWAVNPIPRSEIFSFKDRKSTRLNSSHANISYAVFCLKKNIAHAVPTVARGTQKPHAMRSP